MLASIQVQMIHSKITSNITLVKQDNIQDSKTNKTMQFNKRCCENIFPVNYVSVHLKKFTNVKV